METLGILRSWQYCMMALRAEKIPLESEYPWEDRILLSISRMTSCGAEKPKGAGFPIFSFRISFPSSSIRLASSSTGPLTSYSTLSSFVDFSNVLILFFDCLLQPIWNGSYILLYHLTFSDFSQVQPSKPGRDAKKIKIVLFNSTFVLYNSTVQKFSTLSC